MDGNQYERLGAGLILGCSLLTARGIPASGEGDLKNCQSMKIMDLLGCGGSYTRSFTPWILTGIFCSWATTGRFISASRKANLFCAVSACTHGKRGFGVSVEARVKLGPVTLLAMTQTADGNLKLLAAEGERARTHVAHRQHEQPDQIRVRPGRFVNRWCSEGPTHHCALGVGRMLLAIRNIASLLKLSCAEVGVR